MRDLLKASDISRRKVTSLTVSAPKLTPYDNVGKATRMMTDYRPRALPVLVNESITGVVTDRSMCQLLKSTMLRNVKAGKIMTAKPTTVRKEDTVAKARSLMIRRRFDHLPVVNARGLTMWHFDFKPNNLQHDALRGFGKRCLGRRSSEGSVRTSRWIDGSKPPYLRRQRRRLNCTRHYDGTRNNLFVSRSVR